MKNSDKTPENIFNPDEIRKELDQLGDKNQAFYDKSLQVSRYLHEQLTQRGEDRRELADVLHGKQIGHPLHPILTDMTIGSWSLGLFFDVLGLIPGLGGMRHVADKLIALGVLSAVPTAIAGAADYSTIKEDAVSYGALHGLINGSAFLCFLRSSFCRRSGKRGQALLFSFLGSGLMVAGSWLGGDLVFRHRVGVNHSPEAEVKDWVAVMAWDALPEGEPTRVMVNETPLLLFRKGETVHALNATCSHAGGPLDEGRVVDGNCIECPWHQSVFDMRDGKVVHSPATTAQPIYQVRIEKGQIEVKNWDKTALAVQIPVEVEKK